MPIIEEDVSPHGNEHSESSTLPKVENEDLSIEDVRKAFGLDEKPKAKEEVPPKEQPKPEEKKGITVKFNKEDTFIEEDKIPEYARKGLNYDKIEGRAKELQETLDRAARLHGFKDHAEYAANLDKLEQQQQQKQQTEMDELRAGMLEELEKNGVTRENAEKWLDNHPLFQVGKQALEQQEKLTKEQQEVARWKPLYDAYPDIRKAVMESDGKVSEDVLSPEFFQLVGRGNDPLLAYEHLNRDKIKTSTIKATEQRLIKEQQLGLRAKVETNSPPDNEPQVPAALANAFAAFGLPAESAKKYVKK